MKTAVKRVTCNAVTADGTFYGKFCLDKGVKLKPPHAFLILVISKQEKDTNPPD